MTPPTRARAHWRPDIQGLRAIAIVVVVAYHAGLPVPGGFTGVDIFFVISGFVITGMLRRQFQSSPPISMRDFYWRRFARLTPALALMVGATVVASALLQSPLGSQQTTGYTAIGAMLLVANVVITVTTGDYFDAPAATNPLLHTWSLSVEEQFYLVFPALLLLGWVIGRRSRRVPVAALVISILAVASFAAALVGTYVGLGPRTAWLIGFYGPLSRAWEFAVGALIVLVPLARPIGRATGRLIAGASVILLVASMFLISDTTPFPGPWTLVPVCAAAGLLMVGDRGVAGGVLGSRPMVLVGDRSYSLYLWHWPFIVFAAIIWPDNHWAVLLAVLASLVPMELSYRVVETRFRRFANGQHVRHRLRFVGIIVIPTAIFGVALVLLASAVLRPAFLSGSWSAINKGEVGQESFRSYFDRFSAGCPGATPPQGISGVGYPMCTSSEPDKPVDVLLLGDSYAAQLFPALSERLADSNVAFFDTSGPAATVGSAADNAWINDFIDREPSIRTVILATAWYERGVPDPALRDTVTWLQEKGIDVVLVNELPDFPFDAGVCKYPRSAVLSPICEQDAVALGELRATPRSAVRSIARSTGATEFDPWSLFCTATTCSMAADGTVLYRDLNHVNEPGARKFADALIEDVPSLRQLDAGLVSSADVERS